MLSLTGIKIVSFYSNSSTEAMCFPGFVTKHEVAGTGMVGRSNTVMPLAVFLEAPE